MHEIIHLGVKLVLIVATAILFTVLVVKRPGAPTSYSNRKIFGLLVVGAIIGVVFLTTQSLYAPTPTV